MKNSQILFLALCLITASCDSKKEVDVDTVDTHEVVTPLLKDITYSKEYVAEIQSVKYVEVRSKVKGYIEKIYVDEGQPVTLQRPILHQKNAMQKRIEQQAKPFLGTGWLIEPKKVAVEQESFR